MRRTIVKLMSAITIIPLLLTGCKNMTFNPSLYIQTSLNAVYKGDFTKYNSIVNLSEQSAQENYVNGYKSQVDVLAKVYSFTDSNDTVILSDDLRQQIENIYKEIYAQTFYSVSNESKSLQNGFEVEVSVKPHKIFKLCSNEVRDFVNNFNKDITSGKYNDIDQFPDQYLYNDIYAKGIVDLLNKYLKEPEYDSLKKIKVKVMHNAERDIFYINADDLNNLNNAIISLPNA